MALNQRLCQSPGSKHNTLFVTELPPNGPCLRFLVGRKEVSKKTQIKPL